MLHHSQGESAKAFIRTLGTSPLGQVSHHIRHANWQTEVDNGPWFVCIGLPLSFLYGWFANNAWFERQEETFPVCTASTHANTHHHTYIHDHMRRLTYARTYWNSAVVFVCHQWQREREGERASSLGKHWCWCVWWIFVTMSVWTGAATIPQLFYTINSASPPFVSP